MKLTANWIARITALSLIEILINQKLVELKSLKGDDLEKKNIF